MFYCQECGEKNNWPTDKNATVSPSSKGQCEICGEVALCYDVHHSKLKLGEPDEKIVDEKDINELICPHCKNHIAINIETQAWLVANQPEPEMRTCPKYFGGWCEAFDDKKTMICPYVEQATTKQERAYDGCTWARNMRKLPKNPQIPKEDCAYCGTEIFSNPCKDEKDQTICEECHMDHYGEKKD